MEPSQVTKTVPDPVVSVVMPVFNADRYLDEAILSIRNQTEPGFEFLILDDGSTDQSIEIAKRHAILDPRLRIISLEHGGLTRALNEGLRSAQGAWIARMDADDVALPQRLERQLHFMLENPHITVIGTFGRIIGEYGKVVGVLEQGPTSLEEFRIFREQGLIQLLHPSVMFSRDVALKIGGYRPDYEPAEDLDFWNRFADNHSVLAIPEQLMLYRIHGASVSTSRFIEQKRTMERIALNVQRRRSGLPELDKSQYEHLVDRGAMLVRIRWRLRALSELAYRRGGAALAANAHLKGILWIGTAFCLWPPYAARRLLRQAALMRALEKDDS